MAIEVAIKEIITIVRTTQNGCKNEWNITCKNESCPMFGLTWFNPKSLMTDIRFYMYRYISYHFFKALFCLYEGYWDYCEIICKLASILEWLTGTMLSIHFRIYTNDFYELNIELLTVRWGSIALQSLIIIWFVCKKFMCDLAHQLMQLVALINYWWKKWYIF